MSSISEAWTGLAISEEYTALHVFLPCHASNPRRATLRGRKNRMVASNGPKGAARGIRVEHDLSSYVWPAGWRATAILTYFLLSE